MLSGKKVKLVEMSPEYHSFIVSLLNDTEIAYLEGKVEGPTNMDKQQLWYQKYLSNHDFHAWIAISTDLNVPIGYFSFKMLNSVARTGHVAIKIGKDYQGYGYGMDILKTAMRFYFMRFNMHRLSSHIVEYNLGSQRLFIDKCGWVREGIARKSIYMEGQYYDNILISILKEEFLAQETDEFYNPVVK